MAKGGIRVVPLACAVVSVLCPQDSSLLLRCPWAQSRAEAQPWPQGRGKMGSWGAALSGGCPHWKGLKTCPPFGRHPISIRNESVI